jgi:hypothetical protein
MFVTTELALVRRDTEPVLLTEGRETRPTLLPCAVHILAHPSAALSGFSLPALAGRQPGTAAELTEGETINNASECHSHPG